MKRTFLYLIFISVCSVLIPAPARSNVSGDTISTIRSQYASINKNLSRYKKVTKDAPGFSGEGGTLDAYFDGGSIKKIAAKFYGEMGRTDEEYYYWNGRLIFIFSRESTYNRPLSGEVVSTKESRYYFENGRMIRWLDENGKQVSSKDSSYKEKETESLDTSRQLNELARS